jgi:hypothetical protein
MLAAGLRKCVLEGAFQIGDFRPTFDSAALCVIMGCLRVRCQDKQVGGIGKKNVLYGE